MFQAGSLVVWGVGHVDGKMVRFLSTKIKTNRNEENNQNDTNFVNLVITI